VQGRQPPGVWRPALPLPDTASRCMPPHAAQPLCVLSPGARRAQSPETLSHLNHVVQMPDSPHALRVESCENRIMLQTGCTRMLERHPSHSHGNVEQDCYGRHSTLLRGNSRDYGQNSIWTVTHCDESLRPPQEGAYVSFQQLLPEGTGATRTAGLCHGSRLIQQA